MITQFVAGIIGAPFGLKGQVKVKPLSGEIDHLLKLKSVTVRQNGQLQTRVIAEIAAIPPAVAIRFDGINSPEAAKALQGAELIVDRDAAAPLQPGEWYVEDLKGLAALAADTGQVVGYITAIIEGGGGDLAEIRLQDGSIKLVPFRKEFITDIDLEKRQAILHNVWILE